MNTIKNMLYDVDKYIKNERPLNQQGMPHYHNTIAMRYEEVIDEIEEEIKEQKKKSKKCEKELIGNFSNNNNNNNNKNKTRRTKRKLHY